ncbi:MAG: RNA methyltransferase [Bacteroidales bacterium]|nr:RNA methyltransferase [Candidatus Cacconaster merdequi]
MYRKLLNSELGRMSVEQYKTAEKAPIVIVLDNVRSQHNIGSAFRTADAFRVEKIYLCGICATPPTAEIHKSALGAEFSVDWEYLADTSEAVRKLKDDGYTIVSVEQAENSTMLQDFRRIDGRKYAFVFGNEVKGVQQEVVDASDLCLEIPQYGTKHSLNVSVSIGVVLWGVINL